MSVADVRLWVIDTTTREGTLERIGDARRLADQLGTRVGVALVTARAPDAQHLIRHGADRVVQVPLDAPTHPAALSSLSDLLGPQQPRLVIAPADCHGRELAARLAARHGWRLLSPVLMLQARGGELEITTLDRTERLCRRERVGADESLVATMRDGVGEAVSSADRQGEVATAAVTLGRDAAARVLLERTLPADPTAADIRFLPRLVAGGRGLGGREGFELLRRFASRLGAGVAASRVAVDLGWIEYERQVGQTGRSVQPELYIACGISGASHHLDGIGDATHVVAINTDPQAPIFRRAQLGLVADLHAVLRHAEERLA